MPFRKRPDGSLEPLTRTVAEVMELLERDKVRFHRPSIH